MSSRPTDLEGETPWYARFGLLGVVILLGGFGLYRVADKLADGHLADLEARRATIKAATARMIEILEGSVANDERHYRNVENILLTIRDVDRKGD